MTGDSYDTRFALEFLLEFRYLQKMNPIFFRFVERIRIVQGFDYSKTMKTTMPNGHSATNR